METKILPGPSFLGVLKIGPRFTRNYIDPMVELFDEYGDYVALNGLGPQVAFVFHPDGVEHIFKTHQKNFLKSEDLDHLKPVLGEGLLTSEGQLWKDHRRLIAPEFQHKRMEGFYPSIEKHTTKMLGEWRALKDVVNVAPLVSKATYGIAGDCFFGSEVEDSASVVYEAVEIASRVAIRRMTRPWNLPLSLPIPPHLRLHKAMRELNSVVYGIINKRRGDEAGRTDLLSRMLGVKLKENEVRDEVMTMLLAGHETTSNALAWTLYLLGRDPEVQGRLREELNAKVSGEMPTLEETKSLEYTRMVFEESMRLYPPAATVGRSVIEDDVIGGYRFKKGTKIALAQWVTHKHPAFWDEPMKFKPERFDGRNKHHPYAYFPFAMGPRECVGKTLAMLEGVAILAGIIKNFRVEGVAVPETRPLPLITVRPDPGVFLKLQSLN